MGEVGHWSKEKMELLSRGKGYLYPIQWDEPFGITMVEAMACGTPVLTFERGSTTEVVEHGATGFVVENMDEFMERLIDLDRIEATRCRERVERMFTDRIMVDNYERVYKDVLGAN